MGRNMGFDKTSVRKKLVKLVSRDALDNAIGNEKRPWMMNRNDVENLVVILWPENIQESLQRLLDKANEE
jgi:hypothetical protein